MTPTSTCPTRHSPRAVFENALRDSQKPITYAGHWPDVIASAAKQSPELQVWGLLRRFIPRNDTRDERICPPKLKAYGRTAGYPGILPRFTHQILGNVRAKKDRKGRPFVGRLLPVCSSVRSIGKALQPPPVPFISKRQPQQRSRHCQY